MQKHKFKGKNLDNCLQQAANFFAVDKAFVCYDVLSKNSESLFSKLFSRGLQIEAWVETAKEDLQDAARKAVQDAFKKSPSSSLHSPKTSAPTPKVFGAKKTEQKSTATAFARENIEFTNKDALELLDKYNSLFFATFSLDKSNYTIKHENENIVLKIEDEFLEGFLAQSDKLSLAYEHVFKRLAQKKVGDISGRLSLAAGSSDEKREERLVALAKSLAQKVLKTGKSMVLSSKSSQERRVIHTSLDGYEGIGTRSVGTGDKRRLVIYSLEKREQPERALRSPRAAKSEHPAKNNAQKNRFPAKNSSKKNASKKPPFFKAKNVNE